MPVNHTRTILGRAALVIGALAVLATGAVHLEEYAGNQFSSVPTIGTLFLLNFIAATAVGIGLLAPLPERFRASVRALLALGGIALAASSLIGLLISESSSLFGFMDHGYRPAIVAAIAAEGTAMIALSAYLALTRARHGPRWRPSAYAGS